MSTGISSRQPQTPEAERPRQAAATLHQEALDLAAKGRAALGRADRPAAEAYARAALRADADSAPAHELMGDLHLDQGCLTAALDCFEQGVVHAPLSTSSALKYHTTAIRLGAFTRMESTLRAACRPHPDSRRLRFLLIDCLLRQENHAAAMAEIESAMAVFGPDDGMLSAALQVRSRLGPHAGRATAEGRPAVSLCMIIRNEAEYLARCLHSAKPVVDEIIVVDTGSNDRSPDIARVYGARVFAHAWQDDFSQARNVALSQASGEWVLVLDGDEMLSAKDHAAFIALLHAGRSAPAAYSIQTRNYTHQLNTVGWQPNRGDYPEEAGAGWFPSDKVRLFPKIPGVGFTYPVHEVVEPSLRQLGIPIRPCGIPVHHFGKLRDDQARRKTSAYRLLSRKKLDGTREDPAAVREAAVQASHLGRHAEALELWRRFVRINPASAEAFLNMGTACWNLGDHAGAVEHAQAAIRLNPSLKEAHFNLAMAELHRGRGEAGLSGLPAILDRHPHYLPARFLFAAAQACAGSTERAREAVKELKQSAVGPYLSVSFGELAQTLRAAGQADFSRRVLDLAAETGCSSPLPGEEGDRFRGEEGAHVPKAAG